MFPHLKFVGLSVRCCLTNKDLDLTYSRPGPMSESGLKSYLRWKAVVPELSVHLLQLHIDLQEAFLLLLYLITSLLIFQGWYQPLEQHKE